MAVLGTACSKNSAIDGPEGGQFEYKIGFGKIDVKADTDPVPDPNKNLEMTVYDYLTPKGGTEAEYFNDKIKEAQGSTEKNPVWAFLGGSHNWKEGAHEFIAWVSADENGKAPSFTYDGTTKTLSVAAGTELPGTDNFDFRYASEKVVDWNSDLMDTPVELKVKHLSSALTYSFVNGTSDTSFELTDITVGNITTKAGASIVYGGENGEVVTVTPSSEKGSVSLPLEEGTKTMVWPQEVSGATLTVTYNVELTSTSVDEETGETSSSTAKVEKTASIPVPKTVWEPGKVYNFLIQVVDKSITLTLQVIDWEDWKGSVTYGEGNITTANALEYTSGAAVTSGGARRRNNYFANATDPIIGYFSVYAPSNGSWKIKVSGDTSLLTVTSPQATKTETVDGVLEISGPIVAEDGSTGRVYFNIARAASATQANSIQLNFCIVTSDGREISINSEVTRAHALTITGQVAE